MSRTSSPTPPVGPGPRRSMQVALAAVAASLLAGAVTWGVATFAFVGPQPAEALPAATVGYVAVDLDPGGRQKLEAIETLRRFPALDDELAGDDAGADLRERLFEALQGEGTCTDLSFADDIAPWLGSRAALAWIPGAAGGRQLVIVLQVADAAGAEAGLQSLAGCDGGVDLTNPPGWTVSGDWAVVAGSKADADRIVAQAEERSLADDATYQRWVEEAGEAGIVTMYAAPGVAAAPEGADSLGGSALVGFGGGAGVIRFADGGLEAEFAGDLGAGWTDALSHGEAHDVMATLPGETALALGGGLEPGWAQRLADRAASARPEGTTAADVLAEASAQTGLDLPADADTLVGESLALAVSGQTDVETMLSAETLNPLLVAAKVKGDPQAMATVLGKLERRADGQQVLAWRRAEGYLSVGPANAWTARVADPGNLGQTTGFHEVLPEIADSDLALYVDFDAGAWLDRVVALFEAPGWSENAEPLARLGATVSTEDHVSRGLVRLTLE